MSVKPATIALTRRVEFVDVLRGFALLGVFGANLMIFSGYTYMSESQRADLPTADADRIVHFLELVFIENKFMGLFSLLFGISFYLFLHRAEARGADGKRLFYRRLGWLFVIGAVHGWFLWCFDILRFYALWGLLLPLFLRIRPKTLLILAVFFAALAPALITALRSALPAPNVGGTDFDAVALQAFSTGSYARTLRANWLYDWYLTLSVGQIAYQLAVFGRLLFGLFAARVLLSSDLAEHRKLFWTLLILGGLVGLSGNIIFAGDYLKSGHGMILPFARRLASELGSLGLIVAYASGLALLFQARGPRRHMLRFADIGRMALTCYLLQTLFGLWLFYSFMPGPNLMGKIGPVWLVPIWLLGYLAQLWFASIWLRHFRFGPAEWVWRSLTYWKRQEMRSPALAAA